MDEAGEADADLLLRLTYSLDYVLDEVAYKQLSPAAFEELLQGTEKVARFYVRCFRALEHSKDEPRRKEQLS